MRFFFWWRPSLRSLFPAIGKLLQDGTDRFGIVRMLRSAGFSVHEEHIKEYMENMGGTKRGYVENVLIDQYQSKNFKPFEDLAKLIVESSVFRKDYSYQYSKRRAKKLASKIRRSLELETKIRVSGGTENTLLWDNLKRTAIVIAGCAAFMSSIVQILQFFMR